MGLFSKKESKVLLISYECKVEDKKVSFKVTLQNTAVEVVTQKVHLRRDHHNLTSDKYTITDKEVSLKPLETKTFEFTQEYWKEKGQRIAFSVSI